MKKLELTPPLSKFGGQPGVDALAILRDLHAHGPSTHHEITRRTGIDTMPSRLTRLRNGTHVIKIEQGTSARHQITNRGRVAIGEPVVTDSAQRPARVCNSMMRSTFDPATDTSFGRIGLAVCGAAARA
jgi:hypothetical protein